MQKRGPVSKCFFGCAPFVAVLIALQACTGPQIGKPPSRAGAVTAGSPGDYEAAFSNLVAISAPVVRFTDPVLASSALSGAGLTVRTDHVENRANSPIRVELDARRIKPVLLRQVSEYQRKSRSDSAPCDPKDCKAVKLGTSARYSSDVEGAVSSVVLRVGQAVVRVVRLSSSRTVTERRAVLEIPANFSGEIDWRLLPIEGSDACAYPFRDKSYSMYDLLGEAAGYEANRARYAVFINDSWAPVSVTVTGTYQVGLRYLGRDALVTSEEISLQLDEDLAMPKAVLPAGVMECRGIYAP